MDQNCNAKLDETRLIPWSGGDAPAPPELEFVSVESPEHLNFLLFGSELLTGARPAFDAEALCLALFEARMIEEGRA